MEAAGSAVRVRRIAELGAERLYERMGRRSVGVVPDDALLPRGGFCATRFYCRRLVP